MIEVSRNVYAAQWVLIFALSIVVFVLYRQLAHLLRMGKANDTNAGLAVGDKAPTFTYRPVSTSGESRSFSPERPTLLLFAEPGCGSCEEALHRLEDSGDDRLLALRRLIVTTEDSDLVNQVRAFRESPLEIGTIERDVGPHLFLTSVVPFMFAIDGEGVIRAKGLPTSGSELRRIMDSLSTQQVVDGTTIEARASV